MVPAVMSKTRDSVPPLGLVVDRKYGAQDTSHAAKGKIVTIEGSDGSGKKTQTKVLVEKAMGLGYPVFTMSFPRYDLPSGQRIKEYLGGKWGPPTKVDPKFASELYMDDREAVKQEILMNLDEGLNGIFDRWMESNWGHQASKVGPAEREELVEWMRRKEVEERGLPESNLVVYLDLPVMWSQRAMEKEGRTKDGHEADVGYLLQVEKTYLWLASTRPNWIRIECLDGDRRLTEQEVHSKIWHVVEPVLVR